MTSVRKIEIFILTFVAVGVLACILLPREPAKNKDAVIRMGAGDDISGILMEEVVKELSDEYEISDTLEGISFYDCCSNTAQWAMNAKEINIAFYCNHIALHTVETNKDVMIYGPVIMNAEIICYKDKWEQVKSVGVTQGREQQKSLAKKSYPQIEQFNEITQKAIMYTLEDGQVDAVILDITKAAQVPDYEYQLLNREDYISYVLVVDKEFAKTEDFSSFIDGYNKAVKKLEDSEYLANVLGVNESWIVDKNLKFLTLDKYEE